jgi:uncharacterized protein YndB with AHSA1/START domain
MSIAELSRIDRAIEIDAPVERVWRALTDQQEVAAWFRVTIEGNFKAGEEVWMTSTHEGYAGQRFRVRIVELTPPRRMVWRWHPGEVDPAIDYSQEPETTVTYTLESTATGTRLSVSETGFDEISLARRAKVFADNSQGWAEVVNWIKEHAEGAH